MDPRTETMETMETRNAERLARLFHETYERLAPSFGYATREASAKPWADVPEPNRSLMIAVAGEVLDARAVPDRGAVRDCLAFFASALKSGESWSVTCQQMLDAAHTALRAASAASGPPRAPEPLSAPSGVVQDNDDVQTLHAAASDLRFVASGGTCDPRTLAEHADALLAIAAPQRAPTGERAGGEEPVQLEAALAKLSAVEECLRRDVAAGHSVFACPVVFTPDELRALVTHLRGKTNA
jgi:hypothetical protein